MGKTSGQTSSSPVDPLAIFRKAASIERALMGRFGRLAQLVEHLVYTERVGGSSPSPPTIPKSRVPVRF